MENTQGGYSQRPMWQWVVIYLAIGGALSALIYYIFLKPKTGYLPPTATPTVSPAPTGGTTSATTPPTGSFTITFSSTGFDPKSLTIKVGGTVTWTNGGDKNVFVASSPHPTHTDYPPLNLGIVKPGESKSLTFPTVGVYKYHDHLNASFFGSIIVR